MTVEEWEHCPAELARLQACLPRENPTQPGSHYTVLDTSGTGHFIGCNLSVQALGKPSLSFLGGSFYFCGGTCAGPHSGCTVKDERNGRFAGYKLLIEDAIPFDSYIKVLITHGEHFNSGPIWSYEGQAAYSSVAYWYQAKPHAD